MLVMNIFFNVADFLKTNIRIIQQTNYYGKSNDHLASIGNDAYRVELKGSESTVTMDYILIVLTLSR